VVFVVLFAAILSRTRPRGIVVGSVAVCYLGMALALAGRDEGRAFADPRGALLIVGASVAWAVFVVRVGPVQKRLGVWLSTSVGMAAAAVPALTETVLSGHQAVVVEIPSEWIPGVAGLVLVGTVVPSFLSQTGLARIGAVRSSIFSLAGPAILPLLAMATLGESMPWQQVAGLSVVLAGCAALGLRGG
jgi:drug/metabolite transporter (DMT)-like permease